MPLVLPDGIDDFWRQCDDPAGLPRFWRGDDLPAFYGLVGLGDGKGPGLQVYVLRGECQQFSYAKSCPEQDREPHPPWILRDVVYEGVEIFRGPKVYLGALLLPDASREAGPGCWEGYNIAQRS